MNIFKFAIIFFKYVIQSFVFYTEIVYSDKYRSTNHINIDYVISKFLPEFMVPLTYVSYFVKHK